MRRPALRHFESLEPRLAMAGLAQYYDVDGDIVTVSTDRGTDAQLVGALVLVPAGTIGGYQLAEVALFNPAFARTNLTITARPSATGGNGQVNVGEILAPFDLGRVTVGGDLGRIRAGDGNLATPGVTAFVATSVGLNGTSTGASDNFSAITGPVPSIRLSGSLFNARFEVGGRAADVAIGGGISGLNSLDGFTAASIGRIVVGGAVIGGSADASGRIVALAGGIDRVEIGGSLRGGLGNYSGMVTSFGTIGFARIGGSIFGDGFGTSGMYSGAISSGRGITRLVVGGGIYGGAGFMYSGAVYAVGAIGSMVVGGPVDAAGSAASGSGAAAIVAASIGSLDIGGGLLGGPGFASGVVSSTGRIGTLRVGEVRAGVGSDSGSVRAGSLGTMLVRGNISGSLSQPAIVSALGSATPAGPRAIGALTVGGNMVNTVVLGGYQGLVPVNGAARIGTVTVRGSLFGSSIVAGVTNPHGVHPVSGMPQFGDGFDTPIGGSPLGSRIDSLVVNQVAFGAPDPLDYSGVLANSIGTVRIGGRPYTATRLGIAPTSPNLQFRLVR